MNARKAKELGLVDEILFEEKTKETDEPVEDEKEVKPMAVTLPFYPKDVLFSRKAVEDSFLTKVTDAGNADRTPIASLDKRLNLLIH